jgi:uncharacterized protein
MFAGTKDIIDQVAALPYRLVPAAGADDGRKLDAVMIMLVTSRDTGRWIVPKGNVDAGHTPHEAAAIEAVEEAGLVGWVDLDPIGHYSYGKRVDDGTAARRRVDVYLLAVIDELVEWKESGQRERRWFTQAEAARMVEEPELRAIIAGFTVG